jgi:hypothetical protein
VYAPDFLAAAEEASLLAAIRDLPLHEARYKQYTARRRIASFGAEYDFGQNRLLPGPDLPGETWKERIYVLGLEPRSAYVMRGDARWRWEHNIPATKNLRYSITFLRGLPVHMPAADRDDVVDRTRALLVGFDDDGGHSGTHFRRHRIDEVVVQVRGDRIARQPGDGAQGRPQGRAGSAGDQPDERAAPDSHGRPEQGAPLAFQHRYVATLVFLDHHAGLHLDIRYSGVLESLQGARRIVSPVRVVESRNNDSIGHVRAPWEKSPRRRRGGDQASGIRGAMESDLGPIPPGRVSAAASLALGPIDPDRVHRGRFRQHLRRERPQRRPRSPEEVRLAADGHGLEWVERTGAREVVYTSEPQTRWLRRFWVGFLSLLPIEPLL